MIKWCLNSHRCCIYLKWFSDWWLVYQLWQRVVQLAVKISLITCNMLILFHTDDLSVFLCPHRQPHWKTALWAAFRYGEIVFVLMSWHSLTQLWEMFVSHYLNPYHCLHFCKNGFEMNLILILKDLFKRREWMTWTLWEQFNQYNFQKKHTFVAKHDNKSHNISAHCLQSTQYTKRISIQRLYRQLRQMESNKMPK